jgi:hypothetical protein
MLDLKLAGATVMDQGHHLTNQGWAKGGSGDAEKFQAGRSGRRLGIQVRSRPRCSIMQPWQKDEFA